jgi:hypothetical protein
VQHLPGSVASDSHNSHIGQPSFTKLSNSLVPELVEAKAFEPSCLGQTRQVLASFSYVLLGHLRQTLFFFSPDKPHRPEKTKCLASVAPSFSTSVNSSEKACTFRN